MWHLPHIIIIFYFILTIIRFTYYNQRQNKGRNVNVQYTWKVKI